MAKSTPNLPASSRLKGPSSTSTGKPSVSKNGKATAAVKAGGVVKLTGSAKGGMKKSNKYC